MNMRMRVAASAFLVATILGTGASAAEQKPSGTWSQAKDWNGLSPGSFKTQCEAGGGETTFEGGDKPLWSCTKEGSGAIYCDQGSDTTSTNCRRYTPSKFTRVPPGSTYQTDEGGVFTESRGGSPGPRFVAPGGAATEPSLSGR